MSYLKLIAIASGWFSGIWKWWIFIWQIHYIRPQPPMNNWYETKKLGNKHKRGYTMRAHTKILIPRTLFNKNESCKNRLEFNFFCKEDVLTSSFNIQNALTQVFPFSLVFRFRFLILILPTLSSKHSKFIIGTNGNKKMETNNTWYWQGADKIGIRGLCIAGPVCLHLHYRSLFVVLCYKLSNF
jgi:hypothetical protein